MTHICVSKLTIIGSDNGLSLGRRQAIIWTNDGILSIGPLKTNFNEISIKLHTISFKKIHSKISSGKWRPFCLTVSVLIKNSPAFTTPLLWCLPALVQIMACRLVGAKPLSEPSPLLSSRLLTGLRITDEDSARQVMKQLHELGAQTVVITSSELGPDDYLHGFASHVLSELLVWDFGKSIAMG